MNEELNTRTKNYILMRSIRDYGMGVFLIGLGICFFFSKQVFGRNLFQGEEWLRYFILVIFSLYGAFRFYRGYAKQYYNKDD